ncbi:MAG: glycosyltransferase family 39 protein, partial [Candidatus Roseilinea sp.]|uniref:glycosyltransferase family 39 protein n=1 Tax=Candidatus Roseilinea sp. TaxID=2838777 RepID=UPI00404B2D4C
MASTRCTVQNVIVAPMMSADYSAVSYTNVYSFMSTPVTTDRRSHRRRPSRPSLPVRRPDLVLWMSVAVILLAFALRIANIRAAGDGNPYYTAAVQSMLLSPTNLLYAAAEPGGSVSLDKPPLGFWIQALSVTVLGRSGFAVIWPQIVAGVLSVAIAIRLARKHFGASAGLMAGATLAVLPVSVAVDRNNTIDSLLILTLLLAAGCFLTATTRARMGWPWLIAGALCIGAAFPIKMLQALLPVPAFFAAYFLGNPTRWPRMLVALAAVTMIAGAVSLSWA